MNAKTHMIRRYLLAAVVGAVVGLAGTFARYEAYVEHAGSTTIARIDGDAVSSRRWVKPGKLDDARVLVQIACFLYFLVHDNDNSACNIILGSALLVPFAVYTFDVVAASRRKHRPGVA
jgi:hypothetical protein